MGTTSDDDGDEDHKRPSIIPTAGMCVSLAFKGGRCDGVICDVEAVNGSGFALSVAFEKEKYVETDVSYPEKDDCELQFVYDSNDTIKTTTVPDGWSDWDPEENYYRDRIESIVNGVKVDKVVESKSVLTDDELEYMNKLIRYCKTADEIRECLSRELATTSIRNFAKSYNISMSSSKKGDIIDSIIKLEMILRKFEDLSCTTQNILDKHNALVDSGSLGNGDSLTWSKNMVALCQYVFENGDCLVPQNEVIGKWVSDVRAGRTPSEGSGRLMSQRSPDLAALGFVWNAIEHVWNVRINQLEEFKATFGHCNVPCHYDLMPELGNWVSNIRTTARQARLTPERVKQLDDMGFEWVYVHPTTKRFLAILKAFWVSTGREHCHIPYPTTTNCPLLKSVWPWITKLRKKERRGDHISDWLRKELAKIGFEFDPPSRRKRQDRVETKIFYDFGATYNIILNRWDERIDNESKSRPDGVIQVEVDGEKYLLYLEVDEHRHDDRAIEDEQKRMTYLVGLGVKLGCKGVYILRMNIAERKDIDRTQQGVVADLIKKILYTDRPVGAHAWYVDFPKDHHHVCASKRREVLAMAVNRESWETPMFNKVHTVESGVEAGK